MGCLFGMMSIRGLVDETVINSVDTTRGKHLDTYKTSWACLGVQNNSRFESARITSEGKFVIASLSDCFADLDAFNKNVADAYRGGLKEVKDFLESVCTDYSVAILDGERRRLDLTVDALSLRKLYYYFDGDVMLFSSSLKHVVRALLNLRILRLPLRDEDFEIDSILTFILFAVPPPGMTFFAGIKKTMPGELVEYTSKGFNKETLLCLDDHITRITLPGEEDYVNLSDEVIREAIKARVRAAPTTVSLTSGLDSNLIAAYLAEILGNRFLTGINIAYEGFYDESNRALEVGDALGIEVVVNRLNVDSDRLIKSIDECLDILEEPSTRTSYLSRSELLKTSAKYGESLFMGEAADELFGGYWSWLWRWDEIFPTKLFSFFPSSLWNPMIKFGGALLGIKEPLRTMDESLEDFVSVASNPSMGTLFSVAGGSSRFISKELGCPIDCKNLALKTFKPILNSSEKISKINDPIAGKGYLLLMLANIGDVTVDESLASRLDVRLELPYYDLGVSSMFLSMPGHLKVKGKNTKYIIRRLCKSPGLLPESVVYGPKSRFRHPVDEVMWNPDYRAFLEEKIERSHGFVRAQIFEKLLKNLSVKPRRFLRTRERMYTFLHWITLLIEDLACFR